MSLYGTEERSYALWWIEFFGSSVYILIISSYPTSHTIKIAQHHNSLLSFWQRTSRKTGLHVFLTLNTENVFIKFKAKE